MPLTFAEMLPTLTPAGEVTCLNCGRLLAEVVHDTVSQTLKLRRVRGQAAVQVRVAGRDRLRCQHCNGHALVTLDRAELEPAREGPAGAQAFPHIVL